MVDKSILRKVVFVNWIDKHHKLTKLNRQKCMTNILIN